MRGNKPMRGKKKITWAGVALVTAIVAIVIHHIGFVSFSSAAVPTPLLPMETVLQLQSEQPAEALETALPNDAGYLNVKEFGAMGDGVTDDTAAFQAVLGRNKEDPGGEIRSIYIPNGTYLLSDTVQWGDKRKEVWGQSRRGVILKLQDRTEGFGVPNSPKPLLSTEFGHGGQNFNQRIRNLTIDVGQGNPGAVGLNFHTNNGGGVYNVTIQSSDPEKQGHIGLWMNKEWPGPGLIQNVAIDGFETGIWILHDQYSMTFEHILLTNQRRVGFVNSWNTVAIRDLKSHNRVPAIENQGKMALMTLIEAELVGGESDTAAVINQGEGALFARDITTQGYDWSIDNRSGQRKKITTAEVEEFVSHPVVSATEDATGETAAPLGRSLNLPIADPPTLPYLPVESWVNITQFGAQPNDNQDDGPALQQAIDSGAEIIYLPPGVYRSNQTIQVRGKLQRLMGLNARMIFQNPEQPAFRVEDGDANTVAISVETHYESQQSYWVEHASTRTLILGSGSYINTVPGGKVFIEDAVSVPYLFDHQQVWIRQINTESYDHTPHIVNRGSDLWILGLKTEKDRTIIGTYDGGRTEVLGGLLYKNQERLEPVPAFICEDSQVSLVYRNKGHAYQTQVEERHQGITTTLKVNEVPVSNRRIPLYVSPPAGIP